MKTCENCSNEHEGTYGSGRFCSMKCSRGFSTKAKRKEINEKVSLSLIKPKPLRFCKFCNDSFKNGKIGKIFCSQRCAQLSNWSNEDYKKNQSLKSSETAKQKHNNPNVKFGWQTRKKLEPSYPESIAIKVLNNIGIDYEYEMPLGKYFVDFAIHSKMIAIEIDGQQHKLEERIKTDLKKDTLLKSLGWKVFRIKWPNDNIIESILSILRSTPSA